MITGIFPPPHPPFPCPFQVGDVIRHVEDEQASFSRALVTAVTEATFTYEYEVPVPFITREASSFLGGVALNMVSKHWTIVKRCSPSPDQFRVAP